MILSQKASFTKKTNIVGLDLFTGYEPNFVANGRSMDRYDIQYNDAIEPSGIIVDTTKMQTGISVVLVKH